MRRKGGDGGLRSGGLVPVQRARRDRGRVGALACVLRGKAKARSGVRRSGAVGEDVCGTLKPLPKEKVGATVAAEAEQRRVRVRCGGGTRVGAPGEARLQSASSRPSAGCAPPWQPAPWSRRSRTPRATPDTLTGGYLAEARRSAGRARAPCCHQQPTRRSRRALRAGRAKRGERQGREARVPLSRPPDERTAPAIFLETPARAAMASTRSPLDTAIRTELRAATWPPHARGAGRKASAHERSAQSTVANKLTILDSRTRSLFFGSQVAAAVPLPLRQSVGRSALVATRWSIALSGAKRAIGRRTRRSVARAGQ